jgi:hypothetical protein
MKNIKLILIVFCTSVVIGGIVSSTFLTLVLLPVLYEWMEGGRSGSPVPGPTDIKAT